MMSWRLVLHTCCAFFFRRAGGHHQATRELRAAHSQLSRHDVARVVLVLEASASSYAEPFGKLRLRVKARLDEAESNMKFIGLIREPCDLLLQATPEGVLEILPDLLRRLRVIWSVSKFYNTDERLTALLRKLSGEIIKRNCAGAYRDPPMELVCLLAFPFCCCC